MKTEVIALPAEAAALIQSALPLLQDACSIGDSGDSIGRCIHFAEIQLEAVLAARPGIRGDVIIDLQDMLFDASSLLDVAAAVHPRSGRSLILRALIERLAEAVDILDEAQIAASGQFPLRPVDDVESNHETVPA